MEVKESWKYYGWWLLSMLMVSIAWFIQDEMDHSILSFFIAIPFGVIFIIFHGFANKELVDNSFRGLLQDIEDRKKNEE